MDEGCVHAPSGSLQRRSSLYLVLHDDPSPRNPDSFITRVLNHKCDARISNQDGVKWSSQVVSVHQKLVALVEFILTTNIMVTVMHACLSPDPQFLSQPATIQPHFS